MIPRKEDFSLDFPGIVKDMGFTFSLWEGNVDRKKLDIIDVDHLIQERDLYSLHENLSNIVNYRLENEPDFKILSEDFIKMFKLAQLSVDYLMYSVQHLLNSVELLREEYNTCAKDRDFMMHQLKKKEEEVKGVRKKLKEKKGRKKLETDQHYVMSDYGYVGVYYKCDECPKAFVSSAHLRAHRLRRHAPGCPAAGSGPCGYTTCSVHAPLTQVSCPHAPCARTCPHALMHYPQNAEESLNVGVNVQEDIAVPSLQLVSATVPLIHPTTATQDAITNTWTTTASTLPLTTKVPSSPHNPFVLSTAPLPTHGSMTQFTDTSLQSENVKQSVHPLQLQMNKQSATHSQHPTIHFLDSETILSQPPDPSPQPTTRSPVPPDTSMQLTTSCHQLPTTPTPSLRPRMPANQHVTFAAQQAEPSVQVADLTLQPFIHPTTPGFESTESINQPKSPVQNPTQIVHESSAHDSDLTAVCPPEVSLHSETILQESPVLSPSSSVLLLPPSASSRLHSATPTTPSVSLHPPLSSSQQSVSSSLSVTQSMPSLPFHTPPPASSAFSLTQSHSPPKLLQWAQPLPAPVPLARSRTKSEVDSSRHPNTSQQHPELTNVELMTAVHGDDLPPVPSSVETTTIVSTPLDDDVQDSSSSESDSQCASLLTACPRMSTLPRAKSQVPVELRRFEGNTLGSDSPSNSSSQSSLCAHSPGRPTRRSLLPEMAHFQHSSSLVPNPTPELRARLEALAEDQLRRLGVGLGDRLTNSSCTRAQRQLEQRRRLLSKGYPGIIEKLRGCIEKTVEEEVHRRLTSGNVTNLNKSFVF